MSPSWILMVALVAFLLLPLRFVYDYAASDSGVILLLFNRIPVWTIKYKNIMEVRLVGFFESGMGGFSLRIGNRWVPPYVLIVKKSGVKKVIITPKEPELFVGKVISKIRQT
jgi:hypothetical protein